MNVYWMSRQYDVAVAAPVQAAGLAEREIKALQIAAKSKLTRKGNSWFVPSQAGQGEYEVTYGLFEPRCTCPDYEFRQAACKHVYAVQYVIEREQTADGQTVVTETVKVTRKTYSQNWGAYNAAQTREKSELQAMLYELCKNIPEPTQRTGRPRLSLGDIIFSSCFKVYSTVSGRRFSTDLREAKARGYLSKLPHYNSVFRYLESEALTPYLYELIKLSAAPLKSIESDLSCGVSTALSQAVKHRNHVPHDQVEVRPTLAQSDTHGADQ